MKLVEDFINKVAIDIRSTYFPNEDHGRTENPDYHKTSYTIELYSNGCLTYSKLIDRLAKSCKETKVAIHSLVSKYVESFEKYTYIPK